jgi:hypothetical protein
VPGSCEELAADIAELLHRVHPAEFGRQSLQTEADAAERELRCERDAGQQTSGKRQWHKGRR